MAGSCERGNELSDLIKRRELLTRWRVVVFSGTDLS